MNFRKHISILLASLILLANLSLSFSIHYCKDEIASISFQYQDHEPCIEKETVCCANETSHDACCSNKHIQVEKKIDDVLLKTLQLNLHAAVWNTVWNPSFISNFSESIAANDVAYYCESHAPPLYKLHCQLVLYA